MSRYILRADSVFGVLILACGLGGVLLELVAGSFGTLEWQLKAIGVGAFGCLLCR